MKSVVAVALVLLQVALVCCSVCPTNSKQFGNMCYSLQQQRRDWADAQNQCKHLGGQLATIELPSVNNFLFRNFRRSKTINIWFGLKKIRSKWYHPDGKASVFRRWNSGEPNNVGGNENCAEMWDNGYWNDAPCTQRRPSICEIPANANECVLGTANCHYEATCSDTIGSYLCTCNAGFTGNGTVCKDIDECLSGVNTCSVRSTCKNTIGSYICTCPVGYLGNGRSCTKISGEHNKILAELEKRGKVTDQKLSDIEYLLQKLLGKSTATKLKKLSPMSTPSVPST